MKVVQISSGKKIARDEAEIQLFQNFKDVTPLPFLAIRNTSELFTKKVSKLFSLTIQTSDSEVQYIFDTKINFFKEKIVNLMAAALLLSSEQKNAIMLLGLEDRFRNSLLDMIIDHKQTKSNIEIQTERWLTKTDALTISPDIQPTLNQSGFDIKAQETEIYLNTIDIENHLKFLIQNFAENNLQEKMRA